MLQSSPAKVHSKAVVSTIDSHLQFHCVCVCVCVSGTYFLGRQIDCGITSRRTINFFAQKKLLRYAKVVRKHFVTFLFRSIPQMCSNMLGLVTQQSHGGPCIEDLPHSSWQSVGSALTSFNKTFGTCCLARSAVTLNICCSRHNKAR